jgi:hypothetical protein
MNLSMHHNFELSALKVEPLHDGYGGRVQGVRWSTDCLNGLSGYLSITEARDLAAKLIDGADRAERLAEALKAA